MFGRNRTRTRRIWKISFDDECSSQCSVADQFNRWCDCGDGLAGSRIAHGGFGEEDRHSSFGDGNGIHDVCGSGVSSAMDLGGDCVPGRSDWVGLSAAADFAVGAGG